MLSISAKLLLSSTSYDLVSRNTEIIISDTIVEKDPQQKTWDYSSKKNERLKLREMKRSLRKLLQSRKKTSVKARLLQTLIGGKEDKEFKDLLTETFNESKTKINKSKDEEANVVDNTVRQKLNGTNLEIEEPEFSSQMDGKIIVKSQEKKQNLFKSLK